MAKPIEDALKKIPNRFLLATAVSRRWESIVAGRPPVVEVSPGEPLIDVVLREILSDRIQLNEEDRLIEVIGQPEAEDTEETLFSEAFSPDAAGVKEMVGNNDEPAPGAADEEE